MILRNSMWRGVVALRSRRRVSKWYALNGYPQVIPEKYECGQVYVEFACLSASQVLHAVGRLCEMFEVGKTQNLNFGLFADHQMQGLEIKMKMMALRTFLLLPVIALLFVSANAFSQENATGQSTAVQTVAANKSSSSTKKADGAACSDNSDCNSEKCEGGSCCTKPKDKCDTSSHCCGHPPQGCTNSQCPE